MQNEILYTNVCSLLATEVLVVQYLRNDKELQATQNKSFVYVMLQLTAGERCPRISCCAVTTCSHACAARRLVRIMFGILDEQLCW
jgi:hypothetical protein